MGGNILLPAPHQARSHGIWLAGIRKRWADPLVLWSVRNPESVRESFNAAGWSGARWEARLVQARAIYEAYAGPKVIVEHERLRMAVGLFAGDHPARYQTTLG